MKKLLLIFFLCTMTSVAFAQRFNYVDSQYILDQMPDYKAVQQEIEQVSAQWQAQIEQRQEAIQKKFEEYQAKRVLLNDQQRKKFEQDIETMERELAKFRSDKFGFEGELFKMREEKMRPIQERMMKAVEDVAAEKKSDFIFDKSSGSVALYSNEKFDLSNDVLRKLGITPGAAAPSSTPRTTPPAGGR